MNALQRVSRGALEGRTDRIRCSAQPLVSRRVLNASCVSTSLGLLSVNVAAAAEDRRWAQADERRLLHPVLVVQNIKVAQEFYTEVLGMKTLRYRSFPDGSANGFSGYLPEEMGMAFELVQKAAPPEIRIGAGFRHFSVSVRSIEAALQRAMDRGAEIVEGQAWEAGEVYIRDPSGYLWEVLPAAREVEPVREINLLVSDLQASVQFYQDVLGMDVIKNEKQNGKNGFDKILLCWGRRSENTALALIQTREGRSGPIDRGSNGYIQVAVSTKDVYRTTDDIRAAGGTVVREPGPVPGIGTRVAKVADPDGWVIALVDLDDFNGELCKAGSGSSAICEPEL